MVKKILAAALALTICTTCLVGYGCSSGRKDDPTTLTIAVAGDNDEIKIIEKFIEGYNSVEGNENKKITYVPINDQGGYETWMNKQQYANTLPDMVQVYDFSSAYWTFKKAFRSLSDLMERDGFKTSDYYDASMKIAQSGQGDDDDYYWLPRDYNKVVVCYNTEIFEYAGIETPSDDWTMEDFEKVCKTLSEKSKDIKNKFNKSAFYPAQMKTEWEAVYYPFIKTYGGDLFDIEKTEAFKNYDKVTKALDTLLYYSDEDYTVSPDKSDSDPFASGQAAMVVTSRPKVQSYSSKLNGKIDFVSMPIITDGEDGVPSYIGMGCTGYAITTSCSEEKLDFAWDFLKYIVSEAGQEVFGATGSGVPVLKSLAESETSAWRQFISADLNHEAFVKYSERDLPLSYLQGVPVAKQMVIKTSLSSMMSTLYTAPDREEEYRLFKQDLDKKLQS